MGVALVKSSFKSGRLTFEQRNASGAIDFGVDDTGLDVKFFGATASSFMLWDESADKLIFDGADVRLQDSDILNFGDADDVSVTWDGTNLNIQPATDDTGAIKFGDGTKDMDVRVTLGAAGDYLEGDVGNKALEIVGDVRLDFSSATIASANTDGGLIKGGTSGSPIVEDTANMKFMSFYFDNGATSGSAEGLYIRLYDTGAGKTSQALRAFTSVTDVAAANARGVHASLSFGASGSVTGEGEAVEATLHIPSGGGLAGTVAAVKAAINSDAAGSDPVGAKLAAIRITNQGNSTGMADVDDDCAAIQFDGWTVADGNMIAVKAAGAAPNVTHSIRLRLPDDSLVYLYAGPTALTA